jgi:hypothetical protein
MALFIYFRLVLPLRTVFLLILEKKHIYFETGLNGWYGFTDNGEMNGNGFSYIIGMNLGLNAALGAKYPKVVYRIYANPWYNPTSNNGLIRQTFIWAGTGLSVRLHD